MYEPVLDQMKQLLTAGSREGVFRNGIDPLDLYISISALAAHYISNRHTLEALARARQQLTEAGKAFTQVELGAMIEVPAAALMLPTFLRHFDFVSIGTNDLIQYTLAIDRADEAVAHLYDPWHPAVLRLLAQTIAEARAASKSVCVCGEMAGDPAAAVLLMAMGFDSLSMNATNLPKVKWMLRQINLSKAKELLAQLMTIDNPQVISSSLQLALRNLGLSRMINPASVKGH